MFIWEVREYYTKKEFMTESSQIHFKIVDWLLMQGLQINTTPIDSLNDWEEILNQTADDWLFPFERAVSGGFLADRMAYAFVAGFRAALQRLFPSLSARAVAAFCISEEGGNGPRAIKTRLEKCDGSWNLNGFKTFITCANEAEQLFVAASTGQGEDGRSQIELVLLDRNTPGITIIPLEDLPFIPEIKHATVCLENVAVDESQLLPGDAYSLYIKTFRFIEDVYVLASILGYLFRISCLYFWPKEIKEQILSLVINISVLADADPRGFDAHIAYGGVQKTMDRLMSDITPLWGQVSEDVRKLWERDNAILNIAGKARAGRLRKAWKQYGQ